ncbi:MAG: pectate lyase [Prevotella sp.]|nr:pectate lyase [Prevotella sp.]
MKKRLTLLIVSCLMILSSSAQAPAFPGAEGYGRYVTGGRGGEVRHVTTLEDDGKNTTKGTLRWAVYGATKKTVVFDVGGIIALKKELVIGDNTTIAGQTAPAPGITLRYYTVRPGGNNVIRFIRIRRGEEKDVNDGADATWQREKTGIVWDHCSFSWSIDEIASFYDNRNFTMQWCTLGEALANPGHSKGEHSYGGIWGGKGASFHHNFLCHMQNRVPRFCGARYNWTGFDKTIYANAIQAEIVDFRNCVMYNWGNGNGCYGGTGGGNINIVNNYYKAGPGTANKTRVTQISVATSSNASGSIYMGYCSRYYINGNYVTAAGDKAENYDWSGVKYDAGTSYIDGEYYCTDSKHLYGDNVTYKTNANGVDCVRIKLDKPVEKGEVTTHSATSAYEKVLAYCGASLHRDNVDSRYMDEARNGTTTYTGSATKTGDGKTITHRPGIIDYVRDQGTYELESTARPENWDTDGDGMPDEWEKANGLNPNDASDAMTYTLDTEKQWYNNLEVYLNHIVEHIMKDGNADALETVNEYYPICVNTGIAQPIVSDDVKSVEYFNLDGMRLSAPQHGINIRRITYNNGQVVTTKVMK